MLNLVPLVTNIDQKIKVHMKFFSTLSILPDYPACWLTVGRGIFYLASPTYIALRFVLDIQNQQNRVMKQNISTKIRRHTDL